MAVFLHAAGLPLPDLRRPRPRRQPAEDAADQRRRVRLRRAGGVRGPARPARGDRRRDLRALDGRASGRSWPAPPTRASRPSSRPPPRPTRYRLTRQTFRLARLPIPDPIAYPLAWLTTHVYVRPRGHVVREISATDGDRPLPRAGPARPRRRGRRSSRPATWSASRRPRARAAPADRAPTAAPVETLVIAGGQHSWLYEFAGYRARRRALPRDGARRPARARTRPARIAAATPAERIPDGEARFAAVAATPGGLRTLAQVALPGATQAGRVRDEADRRRPPPSAGRPWPTSSTDPVWAAIDGQAGHPRLRRSPARARRTWSGSSAPAVDPAAPRTCSAGRSSSAAIARTCASSSAVGPWAGHLAGAAVGDRARHAGSARRRTRRCRSCSTWARRRRT